MSATERTIPSADLRARVLADAASTPAPTRRQRRAHVLLLGGVAALAAVALFFLTGGVRRGARPPELVAFTVGFAFVAGVVLTRLSAGARSMLGPPRPVLVGACLAGAPVLAGATLVAAALWPDHAGGEVPARLDLLCGVLTVAEGALPLAALLVLQRGSDPIHPAAAGAALGMSAGAWAVTMAYLRCPHSATGHCLLAHVAPTLALMVFGAWLGRALLRVR